MLAFMVRELNLIEQFRNLSLVSEVTLNSVRLGMLKLTSNFLHHIIESQNLDVGFIDRFSLVEHNVDEDFKVNENGILKFRNRVCMPDVSELKRMILEESHRSSLSIHPMATKMYQDLKKMFWKLLNIP